MRTGASIIFSLIFTVSCTVQEAEKISTYTVSRGNFENTLFIDGYVEPVRVTSAACPPFVAGVVGFLIEDGSYVKKGDVVCIVEVAERQTAYDQLLIDLQNAEVNLSKTRADFDMQYALLEAQVKNNIAETQIALLDSLQLKYAGSNEIRIKKLELERVDIQKKRFEKKLKTLDIVRRSEIYTKELEIKQTTARLHSAKENLEALTIKAPQDGIAIRAIYPYTGKKLQIGDAVWHLLPLINLPEFSKMKVKMQATETDYKNISIDDSVVFSFDAMPDNIAYGKIQMKSPVGKQYKEGSKVKFFEIEATIDSVPTMPDPGFTANCRIILKQVKDTLTIPQIAVFEEDSMKIAYVKEKKGFERRQLSLGLSSQKEVIVLAGLHENEAVSMSKPPAESVKKTTLLPLDSLNLTNPTDSTKRHRNK